MHFGLMAFQSLAAWLTVGWSCICLHVCLDVFCDCTCRYRTVRREDWINCSWHRTL